VYVGPPFVPNAESAELTKPCKGSFYHPPPSAQPATMLSWLDSVGTPIGIQQRLMRHSDIRTTMNVYGTADTADMREALQKVVRLALARA
jgi:integrase